MYCSVGIVQPPSLVGKAALFNDNNEILVLTRAATDDHRPNELDFPGGTIDHQESPLEGMIREVLEETGIAIAEDSIDLAYSQTDFKEQVSRVRFLFVGKVATDVEVTLSHEHSAYQWMSFESLKTVYQHPVWVDGLQYLVDNNQFA